MIVTELWRGNMRLYLKRNIRRDGFIFLLFAATGRAVLARSLPHEITASAGWESPTTPWWPVSYDTQHNEIHVRQ